MRTGALILALSAFAPAANGQIDVPDWENSVSFELIASQSAVRPGDEFELALVARIEAGYHLYGPAEMEPSRTELRLDGERLSFGAVEYPSVIRRDLSGLGTYDLYEGQIVIRVPATASDEGGTLEAKAMINYQVCTDFACSAPATDELTMNVPVADAGSDIEPTHQELFKPKR